MVAWPLERYIKAFGEFVMENLIEMGIMRVE